MWIGYIALETAHRGLPHLAPGSLCGPTVDVARRMVGLRRRGRRLADVHHPRSRQAPRTFGAARPRIRFALVDASATCLLTFESLGGKTPRRRRWPTSSTSASTRSPTSRSCCSCAKAVGTALAPELARRRDRRARRGGGLRRLRLPQHRARRRRQRALGRDVNLAYPIGDSPLALARRRWHGLLLGRGKHGPWFLLAAGICAQRRRRHVQPLLRTASLGIRASAPTSTRSRGRSSIVLMSMAVWLRPRSLDPLRQPRTAGFILPGVAAAGVLALLVVGHPCDT